MNEVRNHVIYMLLYVGVSSLQVSVLVCLNPVRTAAVTQNYFYLGTM